MERGVVSIFGVASRFFVAMSNKGKLYGSVSTTGAGPHPAKESGFRIPTLQANGSVGRGHTSGSPLTRASLDKGLGPKTETGRCVLPLRGQCLLVHQRVSGGVEEWLCGLPGRVL